MLKNITLNADEKLIQAARERAQQENSSLNAEFRRWLRIFTREKWRYQKEIQDKLEEIINETSHLDRQALRPTIARIVALRWCVECYL